MPIGSTPGSLVAEVFLKRFEGEVFTSRHPPPKSGTSMISITIASTFLRGELPLIYTNSPKAVLGQYYSYRFKNVAVCVPTHIADKAQIPSQMLLKHAFLDLSNWS